MNEAALRARLARLSDYPLAILHDDGAHRDSETLVPAAVLVPIELGATPGIILTKRTAHLARHAGQVSFPGGRIDPADPDAEAAALREAWEEIGLDPADVDIQGRLPPYVTGTGYRITPVVGLVKPDPALILAPAEVEAMFRLPLDVLLDPAAPQRRTRDVGGKTRAFWVWPHEAHYIWGATAAILVHLARILRNHGVPRDDQE